jgi:hypothetical protein
VWSQQHEGHHAHRRRFQDTVRDMDCVHDERMHLAVRGGSIYIPFGQTITTERKPASAPVRSFSSATGAWQYPAGS